MAIDYTPLVLEHFKNPRNVGTIENPSAKATEGSPACGDLLDLYLKIDSRTHIIKDIKFQSFGCASNIATGSIITEMAKGKHIDEAEKISWQEAMEKLGGLPPVKMHCSILAIDTLHSAIRQYKEEQGLIPKRIKLDRQMIEEELKHILHPATKLNLIELKIVKYIGIAEGEVTLEIDFNAEDEFSSHLQTEIEEHLQKLPGVKNVSIKFIVNPE